MSPRCSPRCPSCGEDVRWEGNPERPFCSQRCRMVDLGNWAAERYRIPAYALSGDDGWDEFDGDVEE